MTTRRRDLDELTVAILTALSSVGLVKRAQRELEQNKFSQPEVADDGSVTVRCDDGSIVQFPPNSGFDAGTCTCGASGVCRHRIGAVLRYQSLQDDSPSAPSDSDSTPVADSVTVSAAVEEVYSVPGVETTSAEPVVEATGEKASADEPASTNALPLIAESALVAYLRPATLKKAETLRRRGYVATVRPADSDNDEPCTVELGTATVRFLLGSDLRYVRCDCTARTGCEHAALAVWALDAAAVDDAQVGSASVVAVGGTSGNEAGSEQPSDPLMAVGQLVELVLREGLANVGPGLVVRVALTRRLVERAGFGWIGLLLQELVELQAAQEGRSGVDVRSRTTAVLAGLLARLRSARIGGVLPTAVVLGTDEKAETQLGQIRLTGAGASVRSGDFPGSCTVEVALVDPSSSTMLIARRTFQPTVSTMTVPIVGTASAAPTSGNASASGPNAPGLSGAELGRRAITKGVSASVLATGSVVTNAAVRRPDRVVTFRTGGLRRTSALAGSSSADRFADAGLLREPTDIVDAWRQRPPKLLRPILATEDLAAVRVVSVGDAFFDASAQEVVAVGETQSGHVVIRAAYRDVVPGAPAALARFVDDMRAEESPGVVVGRVTVAGGDVSLSPMLLAHTTVEVPDLAELDEKAQRSIAALPIGELRESPNPLTGPLSAGASLLGDLAVDGALGTNLSGRFEDAANALAAAGLRSASEAFRRIGHRIGGPDTSGELANEWANAAFVVSVGLELL